MPSISLNNIVFTGKMNVVPTIKGATFSVNQVDRQTRGSAIDLYGSGLGSSSDTVVIGAYQANSNLGAAYLYSLVGGVWTYQNDLTLTAAQQTTYAGKNIRFGTAASVSGDWAVVSAPGPITATHPGSVYLFRRVNGVWGTTPFQELTPADAGGQAGFNFGYSVAIDGNTLVVGHREANTALGNNTGVVHVFVFNGTAWSLQQTLSPTAIRTGVNGQRVGFSVAVSGDLVVAGGPASASASGTAAHGTLLVSRRTGTTWSAPVMVNPTTTADGFGASVSIRAGKVAVGAPNVNAVHLYSAADFSQIVRLTAAASGTPTITDSLATNSRMGWSVALNSTGTVVAAGAWVQSSNTGAVYVFENLDNVWGPSAISNGGISKLTPSPNTTGIRFGWSTDFAAGHLLVTGTGAGTANGAAGAFYTFK